LSSDLKPAMLWDPSQNGLFLDCPQRQRLTTLRPPRPKAVPGGVGELEAPAEAEGAVGGDLDADVAHGCSP